MKEIWQRAFGQMTYGIYVLTTRHGETLNGMIASWVTQVSHDPPLILAAVHPRRYSRGLIKDGGYFALHVVEKSQQDLLARFKGPDPAGKFSGIRWERGTTGCPVLDRCMAWFECRVAQIYSPGNHDLFVGEVVNAGMGAVRGVPLCTLDYDGVYTGRA